MTPQNTVDDTIKVVDQYQQTCQLISVLPEAPDEPQWISCPHCGCCLGCVGNSRGVAFGQFERRDHQWSRLTSAAVIAERRVRLKCVVCGKVRTWQCRRSNQA